MQCGCINQKQIEICTCHFWNVPQLGHEVETNCRLPTLFSGCESLSKEWWSSMTSYCKHFFAIQNSQYVNIPLIFTGCHTERFSSKCREVSIAHLVVIHMNFYWIDMIYDKQQLFSYRLVVLSLWVSWRICGPSVIKKTKKRKLSQSLCPHCNDERWTQFVSKVSVIVRISCCECVYRHPENAMTEFKKLG